MIGAGLRRMVEDKMGLVKSLQGLVSSCNAMLKKDNSSDPDFRKYQDEIDFLNSIIDGTFKVDEALIVNSNLEVLYNKIEQHRRGIQDSFMEINKIFDKIKAQDNNNQSK